MAWSNKSQVITFRLTPRYHADKIALERLWKQKELGFSYRETITDSLLKSDGMTVEMYRAKTENITIANIEDVIEDTVGKLLEEMAAYIIKNVISDVRSGTINTDDDSFTEQEQTSYEQKMVAAMMQRRKQKGK